MHDILWQRCESYIEIYLSRGKRWLANICCFVSFYVMKKILIDEYRHILRVNNSDRKAIQSFCYINSSESYLPNVNWTKIEARIISYELCTDRPQDYVPYCWKKRRQISMLAPPTQGDYSILLPSLQSVTRQIKEFFKIIKSDESYKWREDFWMPSRIILFQRSATKPRQWKVCMQWFCRELYILWKSIHRVFLFTSVFNLIYSLHSSTYLAYWPLNFFRR